MAGPLDEAARKARHPPGAGPRRIPIGIGRGLTMHIDFAEQTRTYLGLYEIELNRYLRRILKPGCTAFDIGAQYGYDSLVIAARTGARVAAFECEPVYARIMERNSSTSMPTRSSGSYSPSSRSTSMAASSECFALRSDSSPSTGRR